MTMNQESVDRLHEEYRRQFEENKKLKDAEEEWLKLHTSENDDGA